ncbi:uncharacterized protein KY384_002330 [Bacidia gigantensis]|uniref:uncharacterized protein n=1 Tax=Bacidia gigantensis TaxID=2732470 RepID=UPI001D043FB3|nr:uncharacterized protein KY384_002330 [Bacidia gigantensis]KAG8532453.1 hypothetical protein KY384_002330 [Bacidia gigantensis]
MAFLLLSTTFALSITFSAAQTITVPGLPTSLAPTATPVTAIISAVSSALPSPELGDPFSLSTYPACALSCNTDVNNTVSYDTSNIQYLCSADYRSRTSACQKVTCSSSDYDKSTLLGAEVCGALYNNDTALGSSVSSAIASATAFAANAVANKDPTKQADYPPCAVITSYLGDQLYFTCPPASEVSYGDGNFAEPQPTDFICAYNWKPRGIALTKIDTLIVMVEALSLLALQDFNKDQETFRFSNRELLIRLSSTRVPDVPGFTIKEMLWAIRTTACYFQTEDRYGEINWAIKYSGYPHMGVGQLAFDPTPPQDGPNMTSFSNATAGGIAITDVKVLPDGPTYPAATVYSVMMNLIIAEAEKPNGESFLAVTGYDRGSDASIGIGATSVAAANRFTHGAVKLAIADLAIKMSLVPHPYRWRQCTFLIRINGRIIGRGAFGPGRPDADMFNKVDNTTVAPVNIQ